MSLAVLDDYRNFQNHQRAGDVRDAFCDLSNYLWISIYSSIIVTSSMAILISLSKIEALEYLLFCVKL